MSSFSSWANPSRNSLGACRRAPLVSSSSNSERRLCEMPSSRRLCWTAVWSLMNSLISSNTTCPSSFESTIENEAPAIASWGNSFGSMYLFLFSSATRNLRRKNLVDNRRSDRVFLAFSCTVQPPQGRDSRASPRLVGPPTAVKRVRRGRGAGSDASIVS